MADAFDRRPEEGIRIEWTLDGNIAVRTNMSYTEMPVEDGVVDCRRFDTSSDIVQTLYESPDIGVMVGPYDESGVGPIVNGKYIEKMKQLFGW